MNVILKGKYKIRDFLYGDAFNLAKHADNPNIASTLRHSFPSPYTIEYARTWIYNAKKFEKDKRFCIDYDGECIGDIGFVTGIGVYRFNAEIGYWLSQDHWGKGIMSLALKTLCDHAFNNFEILKLFADVQGNNIASVTVLEKCGFKREALLKKHMYNNNQFYDQYIYSRLKFNQNDS